MPVQVLNKAVRDDIYRRTLDAVRHEVGNMAAGGHCLEFAWQGYRILKTWPGAPRAIIQAGSAQWPRVAEDDGVSPTHFAYEWHADSDVARLIQSGITAIVRTPDGRTAASLPEMHVWLGCPATGEIIDFTTGFWPVACKALLGEDWLATIPPEYLWTFGNRLPAGVRYIASPDAIELVINLLHRQDREYP